MPIPDSPPTCLAGTLLELIESRGTDPELAQAMRTALSADPGYNAWYGAAPELQARYFALAARVQEYQEQVRILGRRLAVAEKQLGQVTGSASWQLTAPLRATTRPLRSWAGKIRRKARAGR